MGQEPAWEWMVGLVSLDPGSATQARLAQTAVGLARGLGVAMRAMGALRLLEQLLTGQAVLAVLPGPPVSSGEWRRRLCMLGAL